MIFTTDYKHIIKLMWVKIIT